MAKRRGKQKKSRLCGRACGTSKQRRRIALEVGMEGRPWGEVKAAFLRRKKPYTGRGGTGYASRKAYLQTLGFDTYAAYLASELWAGIRVRVFAEKGRLCLACGAKAYALHHLRYHITDLRGETLENIVPVCFDCHHACEFDGERKVSVVEAAERYHARRTLFLAGGNP